MSEYITCVTEFKDQSILIEALKTIGNWTDQQIEIHEVPQQLRGYRGDPRQQRGHIIIRRRHVGTASNDIGFERQPDGSFTSHISRFDRGRLGQNQAKLKEEYGYRIIKRQQEAKGRRVTKTVNPNGRTRVVVEGFR